ncbi:hypothetical protein EYF80_003288 [Liparis tanakae]|uniref:Uncharacterized protein n=1 Tax=Liparis tanakae TaxID=230148 RepID=A0A4Z2JA22_9TELE|nr:hypothetical protein EYF80_003288 [Liparis tanakae]
MDEDPLGKALMGTSPERIWASTPNKRELHLQHILIKALPDVHLTRLWWCTHQHQLNRAEHRNQRSQWTSSFCWENRRKEKKVTQQKERRKFPMRSVKFSRGAAGTLRQSALIFLLRTVTFEAISSGVAHKECHGGKTLPTPHASPPTSPAPHCLGHVAIRGLQKLISGNVRILPGAVLGSARPLHAINSSPLSQKKTHRISISTNHQWFRVRAECPCSPLHGDLGATEECDNRKLSQSVACYMLNLDQIHLQSQICAVLTGCDRRSCKRTDLTTSAYDNHTT